MHHSAVVWRRFTSTLSVLMGLSLPLAFWWVCPIGLSRTRPVGWPPSDRYWVYWTSAPSLFPSFPVHSGAGWGWWWSRGGRSSVAMGNAKQLVVGVLRAKTNSVCKHYTKLHSSEQQSLTWVQCPACMYAVGYLLVGVGICMCTVVLVYVGNELGFSRLTVLFRSLVFAWFVFTVKPL